METFKTYWQDYWSKKRKAGHRESSRAGLSLCARELLLYFPEKLIKVLELGCGSGELYGVMKHRFLSYVGVDYSESMLDEFRQEWPDVDVIKSDICELSMPGKKFDLVFSNAVCQYLDKKQIKETLDKVYEILADDGVYLIGSIPDSQLRWHYYAGALRSDTKPSIRVLCKNSIDFTVRRLSDGIGHWYSRYEFSEFARKSNYDCKTYSAACSEYRYHAVLKKRAP